MVLETLQEALSSTEPASTETAAIEALVDAYGAFAAEATATLPTPIPLLAAGLAAGKTAMASSLVGMSTSGAALTQIPASIVSFWSAVALALSGSFAGATAITPPPHTTLTADFAATTLANASNASPKEEALNAIAEIMYNGAILGGTVTVATVVYPIV